MTGVVVRGGRIRKERCEAAKHGDEELEGEFCAGESWVLTFNDHCEESQASKTRF